VALRDLLFDLERAFSSASGAGDLDALRERERDADLKHTPIRQAVAELHGITHVEVS